MKKIALVTGGNRGIGFEVCRQLLEAGFEVLLGARNREKGSEKALQLGEGCIFLSLDVSDEESIQKAASWVFNQYGKLDVLINNAAIMDGNTGLAEANPGRIHEVMNINFYGPIMMNKAFIPLLRNSDDGRIINVSSEMGALDDLKAGNYAGYRLSKVGLNAQTIMLAGELEPHNIRVNAVCPGWVRTDMGGPSATRPVEKGAETIVWLSTAEDLPSGKFFRDKQVISWM